MDYFEIAYDLNGILKTVGLGEFGDALWAPDSRLTYPEIVNLSLWALTGAPADEARESKEEA